MLERGQAFAGVKAAGRQRGRTKKTKSECNRACSRTVDSCLCNAAAVQRAPEKRDFVARLRLISAQQTLRRTVVTTRLLLMRSGSRAGCTHLYNVDTPPNEGNALANDKRSRELLMRSKRVMIVMSNS